MVIALDTNIAIDLLNGNSIIEKIVSKYNSIYLPVTVCGELLFGAKNSQRKEINQKRFLEFINSCIILENNLHVADNYAEIRLKLKMKGRPIPENDIWIAAVCISNEIKFISRDKHFENIENLDFIHI